MAILEQKLGIMWGRMLLFICLFVLFFCLAVGPVKQETIGPLENALRDPENFYMQSMQKAANIPGRKPVKIGRLSVFAKEGITQEHLRFIQRHTFGLNQRGFTAISLTNYWRRGGNGDSDTRWFTGNEKNLENWHEQVCQNKAICGAGKLVNGDFTEIAITLFIDGAKNEVPEMLRLWKYLHLNGKQFESSWEEWWFETKYGLWEYDVPMNLKVEGATIHLEFWSSVRTGIVFGLIIDSVIKSGIGYIFLLVFLMFYFRFQASYYWPVWWATMFSVVFTMGGIWFLRVFGVYQNPYTLTPIITTVIMALSASLQSMESLRFHGNWKKVKVSTQDAITKITLLTVVNFCYFGFSFSNLQRAIDIEAVLLLGQCAAWGSAVVFLQPLYCFFVRDNKEAKLRPWQKNVCNAIDHTVERLNQKIIARALIIFQSPRTRKGLYVIPTSVFFVSCLLFWQGFFITESEPLGYLPQNSRHVKDSLHAKQVGSGIDDLLVMFGMPKKASCVEDEECLNLSLEFIAMLKNSLDISSVYSVSQEIDYQRRMDPKGNFSDIVSDVLIGQEDMSPNLKAYLNPSNYLLILLLHNKDNSGTFRALTEETRQIADEFEAINPDVNILLDGDNLTYIEMARLIPLQCGQFVFSSLIIIFAFSCVVIAWKSSMKQKIRTGWVSIQPFFLATGLIGMVMVVLKVPLDMATMGILPTVIACGSDSCFYPIVRFLQIYKGNLSLYASISNTLEEKGPPAIIDMVSNSLILVILLASYFSPVRQLGSLSISALVICISWSIVTTLPLLAAGIEEETHETTHLAVVGGGDARASR